MVTLTILPLFKGLVAIALFLIRPKGECRIRPMSLDQIYRLVSVLILAALLFLPASKLIWVMSVRRLQRRLQRELNQQELDEQLRRARVISLFLVLIFSYLFHISVLEELHG